jgi:4-carboxymuconolactone decarboxylase
VTRPGAARSPLVPPVDLDPEQRAFYQRLLSGTRARAGNVPLTDPGTGALLGPFAVMAIAPAVGEAVQQVGSAVRYESLLDPLVREAAILMIAVHESCAFEWFAHEELARTAGLEEAQIQQIRNGDLPAGLAAAQSQALRAVDLMLRTKSLDDAAYRDAHQALGEIGLAELVWLTGYYLMLALSLAVFDPPLPLTSSVAWRPSRIAK